MVVLGAMEKHIPSYYNFEYTIRHVQRDKQTITFLKIHMYR